MADISKITVGGVTYDVKDETARENSVASAEMSNNVAQFKNAAGVVLFTLDLSGLSTPAVYGNLVLSTDALTIAEGASGTFTVKLESAPSANQVVYLALSDSEKLSVSPATLTFTPSNWDTAQTVTLTAAQDEDMDNEEITVTLTSKNVDGKQLLVTISDDDLPALVTNGLTLNFNLRNGDLTDSVGGVVATNSGTVVDGGVQLASSSTKFQFVYPVKTANFPNGVTIEYAITGMADLQGAGAGWGNGYAYKGQVDSLAKKYLAFYGGFAYSAGGSTVQPAVFDSATIEQANIDWATEHHLCAVYNTDGSVTHYMDGVAVATRDAVDGFENYLASGNITFKIPYNGTGGTSYPATLHELRIYERALTADEVQDNYKYTVAGQSAVNF